EGAIPKLFPQSWEHEIAKNVFSYGLSRQLATSVQCTLMHALTPLCHFTWPTTLWLSCCCSQLLPLCYNATNS
ncbi:unnamed protein product, partial [Staurois parvus]